MKEFKLEFANGGFSVVTSHIVPFDAIGIKVVEDSDANLVAVAVVRLGFGSRLLTARKK